MTRFEGKEDLALKVDWEGGVAEAITGYGIHYRDLPEDTPTWVIANWKLVYESRAAIERIEKWLEDDGEAGVNEPRGDSPDSPPTGGPRVPGEGPDVGPADASADYSWPRIPEGYEAVAVSPLYVSVDCVHFHEVPDGTSISDFLVKLEKKRARARF